MTQDPPSDSFVQGLSRAVKPDRSVKALTGLAERSTQSDLWGAAQDLDSSMIRVSCLGTVACTFL